MQSVSYKQKLILAKKKLGVKFHTPHKDVFSFNCGEGAAACKDNVDAW